MACALHHKCRAYNNTIRYIFLKSWALSVVTFTYYIVWPCEAACVARKHWQCGKNAFSSNSILPCIKPIYPLPMPRIPFSPIPPSSLKPLCLVSWLVGVWYTNVPKIYIQTVVPIVSFSSAYAQAV